MYRLLDSILADCQRGHSLIHLSALFTAFVKHVSIKLYKVTSKLEDLKVLKRSPDLLNNVEIGQGQLQLIMKHILF